MGLTPLHVDVKNSNVHISCCNWNIIAYAVEDIQNRIFSRRSIEEGSRRNIFETTLANEISKLLSTTFYGAPDKCGLNSSWSYGNRYKPLFWIFRELANRTSVNFQREIPWNVFENRITRSWSFVERYPMRSKSIHESKYTTKFPRYVNIETFSFKISAEMRVIYSVRRNAKATLWLHIIRTK